MEKENIVGKVKGHGKYCWKMQAWKSLVENEKITKVAKASMEIAKHCKWCGHYWQRKKKI